MSDCRDCANEESFRELTSGKITYITKKIQNLLNSKKEFKEIDLTKGNILNNKYIQTLDNILLKISGPNGEIFRLLLNKTDIYEPGFKLKKNGVDINQELGYHYFGIVDGYPESYAVINIFWQNQTQFKMTGMIRVENDPYEISIDETNLDLTKSNRFKSINLRQVPTSLKIECNTDMSEKTVVVNKINENTVLLEKIPKPTISTKNISPKYIRLHCDLLVVTDISDTQAFNNLVSIFTGMKNVFINDPDVEVTLRLISVSIWIPDSLPWKFNYSFEKAENSNLNSYRDYRRNNLEPNTDVYWFFVENPTTSGISKFNSLCRPPEFPVFMTYSRLISDPNFAFNVFVCSHELGHICGSRHTFDCVWERPIGVSNQSLGGCKTCGGQCDSCASTLIVGNCNQPGGRTPESNTLMSYCINFTPLVFGPQPGSVIRRTVDNAACLPNLN